MLLFNARMLAMAGENGVAASTITFYVFGLMSALYMGYMFGVCAFGRRQPPVFPCAFNGGFNTFASMLFTALSNGKISAVLSFSRTFVFLTAFILLLPVFWGINGLWLSVPASKLISLFLSVYFGKKYQKVYGY